VDNTTDGATGLPVIAAGDNLTIVGNGDTIGRSTASGTPAFRLLDVATGATLTLQGLTLNNGWAQGAQGAFQQNGGAGQGGAILVAGGAITLNNSTLSDNTAEGGTGGNTTGGHGDIGGFGQGGAIYVNGGGSATLMNSTLSGNTAQAGAGGQADGGTQGDAGGGEGGALYSQGTLALTNVTVSGNSASGGAAGDHGGGLYNSGTATLTNVTVSDNSAGNGGGLTNTGTITLVNTIIAGNSAATNPNVNFSLSGGNNLLSGDPMLAPLGDYGGPTQTMALLPGSPAIDAGDSTAPGLPSTDQRGFARISGAAVDLGAYEVQLPTLSPATLADGTYGTAYSQTLTATEDAGGAGGPYTFAVTTGTLPTGLSLASDGTLSGTPTAAASSSFTVTATDSAGYTSSQSYTLTIDKAALTITADSTSKTYGQTLTFAGTEFTASGLVNGDTVSSVTLTSAGAAASAGVAGSPYAIMASAAVGSGLDNYTVSYVNGSLTVSPAALTITADNQSMTYGGSVPTLTYHYSGLVNGDTSASFTGGLTTTATPSSGVGSYPITQGSLAATGNYTISTFNPGTLTVTPAPLSAAAANFSATAGAPVSGTVATFTTPDQTDGAAAFTAVITWGDGSTSNGVITGSNGSFTVSGSHTYAAAASYAVSVQISNPNTQSATANDTATVTSLGQGVTRGLTGGIGFWHNKNGQALINCFNGGPSATALGNWLAACFPNLYGSGAGANCLAGKSNARVAAYYQTLFNLGGAQAQVLAVALNVYATTSSMGGNAGASYGFTASATGLGARSFNVGQDGAAFGVANNSTLSVYGLLAAVNKQAVSGVLYGGNATLQAQCADLFSALDQAGGIG